MSVEAFQQRVIDEQKELSDRIEKLHAFITTKIFHDLAVIDQDNLMEQHMAMVTYNRILQRRIARFA